MQPFEIYLKEQKLEALTIAMQAKVRYLTVWNAINGKPITPEHARKIQQTVFSITGILSGPLAVTEPEPVADMQTIPIQKINGK